MITRITKKIKTLRGKFIFYILPPLIIYYLLFTFAFGALSYWDMRKERNIRLNKIAHDKSRDLALHLWNVNFDYIEISLASLAKDLDIKEITVLDHKGQNISQSENTVFHNPDGPLPITSKIIYDTGLAKEYIGNVVIIPKNDRIHKRMMENFIRDSLLLLMLVIIFIIRAMHVHKKTIDVPLNRFLAAIRLADKKRIRKPVRWSSDDELGSVIHAYNRLVENLGAHEQSLWEKNQKIMDSIEYAKMIQRSLLPTPDDVRALLPRSFMIWMPKDGVGGDFFFVEGFDEGILLGIIDCTGHGVPGALMTMLASSGLHRIINDEGCRDPGMILERLNLIVRTILYRQKENFLSDDGMDAAFCLIPPNSRKLVFSGARIPLLCMRENGMRLIKGDRHSIGYQRSDPSFQFTTHHVSIEKGTRFYLTTDGFTDQLGGNRPQRFGFRRFNNLIRDISGEPFDRQRDVLLETFNTYKGKEERRDDITVIGFDCHTLS